MSFEAESINKNPSIYIPAAMEGFFIAGIDTNGDEKPDSYCNILNIAYGS
jgi:hypothetical protein